MQVKKQSNDSELVTLPTGKFLKRTKGDDGAWEEEVVETKEGLSWGTSFLTWEEFIAREDNKGSVEVSSGENAPASVWNPG